MGQKLTSRQQRFIDEYLIDLNGTQAAIRAGYSPGCARTQSAENLAKPNVSKEIDRRKAELAAKAYVSQEWVLLRLKSIVERSLRAEPVTDVFGRQVLEYQKDPDTGEMIGHPVYCFDSRGANGALAILAKYVGIDKGPETKTAPTLIINKTYVTPDPKKFLDPEKPG